MSEVTVSPNPGGPRRGELVTEAWGICGISDDQFGLDADMITAGIRTLNTMMTEHPFNRLGYEQPDYGAGLPEEGSGIRPDDRAAVVYNLAFRLAPTKGKSLSPEARIERARSFNLLCSRAAVVPRVELPIAYRGAGYRGYV